jgi:hypothetical protein
MNDTRFAIATEVLPAVSGGSMGRGGGGARYGWGFCYRMIWSRTYLPYFRPIHFSSYHHAWPALSACGRAEFHRNGRKAARFDHHPISSQGVPPDRYDLLIESGELRSVDEVIGAGSLGWFRREDLLPRSRFDTPCFIASAGGRMVGVCHYLQPGGVEGRGGCSDVVSGQPLHEDPVAAAWRQPNQQSVPLYRSEHVSKFGGR